MILNRFETLNRALLLQMAGSQLATVVPKCTIESTTVQSATLMDVDPPLQLLPNKSDLTRGEKDKKKKKAKSKKKI